MLSEGAWLSSKDVIQPVKEKGLEISSEDPDFGKSIL